MEEFNNIKEIILIVILSYIFGSIPFGFIFTKLFLKKDIRNIGSGNVGATNVMRTGNKLIGYFTLMFDILKAVIPILIIKLFFFQYIYIASLCIFLGHIFPVWLKFKGGKGIATYIGILFCLNIYLGISFCLIWIIIFSIFKYSSLSSLIATIFIPIINYLFFNDAFIFFYIIIFVLIFFSHRENIKRLINSKESKSKIY